MSDVVSRLRVMSFMICGEAADTIEAQAERIRVLREALEKAMNYARCDYASSFRPHFEHVMK